MPLFDFECKKCQKVSEELIRNDEDLEGAETCPDCGGKRQKLIGTSHYHMDIETYLEHVRGVNALAPAPVRVPKNMGNIGHSKFGAGMRGHYEKRKG